LHLSSTTDCKHRKLIGTRIPLHIHIWSPEKELQMMDDLFDREYDPNFLEENEKWIVDLFEPIRSKLFSPPNSKFYEQDVQFFLTSQPHHESAYATVLRAQHPKLHGVWFEVILLRYHSAIHVFKVESYGRTFLKKLVYTSNSMLAFKHSSPNSRPGVPIPPWEPWARHETGSPDVDPRPVLSCTISRRLQDDIVSELERERNPLLAALRSEDAAEIQTLINRAAHATMAVEDFPAALDSAVAIGHEEAVNALVNLPTSVDQEKICQELVHAVELGKVRVMHCLANKLVVNNDGMFGIVQCEEICRAALRSFLERSKIEVSCVRFLRCLLKPSGGIFTGNFV
jgi:hypothetical protein